MDNIRKINKLDKEIKRATTRKKELDRKINNKVYYVFVCYSTWLLFN